MGELMADFSWINDKLPPPSVGIRRVVVPIDEFVVMSEVDEDSNWLRQAQTWGNQQEPRIGFGMTQDGAGVVLTVIQPEIKRKFFRGS
jgi:hypothetical protein